MEELNKLFNLTNEQILQFEKYYEILEEESKKYNLTSITSKEEVYIKHFYDSALPLKKIDLSNKKVIDVGSGAGFPGIPLKIVNPSIKMTLVEPTTKRANFLKMVIEKLNLKDIEVINDRAENIINDYRESFDYATARAVAPLNILLELLTPFVKVNGSILALKGSSYNEELMESKNAFKELNVELTKIYHESLPNELGERPIIVLTKTKQTNKKYPRAYAQIKKKPL